MKIRNLIFYFGSVAILSLFFACGNGSNSGGISAGEYCYKFEESIASALVSLKVNADGTVSGMQQNLLTDKDGNKKSVNHALISGTISGDTLNVELTKDIRGDVQVKEEVWMISDTMLNTAKLVLSVIDCPIDNWVDIPTSFNIQGKWGNDTKADDFVNFETNIYTQISEDRIGGKYNASFDIMDTCGIRLSSLGKYIVLQNGLCIKIDDLTETQMTLSFPGLDPVPYTKVEE